MAQQILSTNTFTTAKWIVSATASDGTHTTIASALTSASSGDTIFIRPGTYTENLTLKAGVNLTAFGSDSSLNFTGKVIISGTCTLTTAGSVTISGIQLQTNSAALLAVTGSAASIVNLQNCYLNCTNATGITFSSSSASARVFLNDCTCNIGTTGISLFAHSSAGNLETYYTSCANTGSSLTASTISAGIFSSWHCNFNINFTSSSTGSVGLYHTHVIPNTLNITAVTVGGSGSHVFDHSTFLSGTASAISISQALTITRCTINSSNTNAITGAGTINFGNLTFQGTSSTINTTTQTGLYSDLGKYRATKQASFLANSTGESNITGDGTFATLTFATEVYDQGSNFSSTTFTAPVTGTYIFTCSAQLSGLTSSHTLGYITLNTTSNGSSFVATNVGSTAYNSGNTLVLSGAKVTNMAAGDTCSVGVTVSNGTKVVDVLTGANTFFSGALLN